MAHVADGGLAVVEFGGGFHHSLGHGGVVLIGGQQGRADLDALEVAGIALQLLDQIAVLPAVHQMGGLNQQILHAVGLGPLQGIGHVVDQLAVPAVDVLNDDVGGKAAADGVTGERFLQRVLNGADGGDPVVVVAGAEANHQQLVLANAVLIARLILGGVAGGGILQIAAENGGHLGAGSRALGQQLPVAANDKFAGHGPVHVVLGPARHIGGVGEGGELVLPAGQRIRAHPKGGELVDNFGDLLALDAALRIKGIVGPAVDNLIGIGPNHGVLVGRVIVHILEGIVLPGHRGGAGQTVQGHHQIRAGHGIVGPKGGRGLAVNQLLCRHFIHIFLGPGGHVGVPRLGGKCGPGQAQGEGRRQYQRHQFVPSSHVSISSSYDRFFYFPKRAVYTAGGAEHVGSANKKCAPKPKGAGRTIQKAPSARNLPYK